MTESEACYGTEEYYCEQFADILADCATGRKEEDLKTIRNILTGFERAIINWLNYHDDALARYRQLHGEFLTGSLDEITEEN
jgi:hypothetical protein